MKNISEKRKKVIKDFWNFWENKNYVINSFIVIVLCLVYHFGYLGFIRENAGNLIAFGVALLTLNGVFMTLLVTLKESPIFEQLRKHFPALHDNLYEGLKNQVARSIYFILINLIIGIVGGVSNIYVAYCGLILWSYLISDISFGTLYNLRVVKQLVEAKIATKQRRV